MVSYGAHLTELPGLLLHKPGSTPHKQEIKMPPAHVELILACVGSIRLDQGIPISLFQRLLGLRATAAQFIPLGVLHMRPLQQWLKCRGFHLQCHPLQVIRVTCKCPHTLLLWRRPRFLTQDVSLRVCCHLMDASLTGWGAIFEYSQVQTTLTEGSPYYSTSKQTSC